MQCSSPADSATIIGIRREWENEKVQEPRYSNGGPKPRGYENEETKIVELSYGSTASDSTLRDGAFTPSYKQENLVSHPVGTVSVNGWIPTCLLLKIFTETLSLTILPYFVLMDLKASPVALGWSIGLFTISQMIATLLYGRLSDSLGRRPLLILSFSINSFGFILMAISQTFPYFLLSHILVGLSSVSVSLTHAMIVDVTPLSIRPIIISQIKSYLTLGFMVGPAMGGLCYYIFHNRRYCLYLCSAGAMLTTIVGYLKLPETLPASKIRPILQVTYNANTRTLSHDGTVYTLFTRETKWTWEFGIICLIQFLFSVASASMGGTYYTLIMQSKKLDTPDFMLTKVVIVSGMWIFLYQEIIYPLIIRNFNLYVILMYGCVLQSIGIYLAWFSAALPLWMHLLIRCLTYLTAQSVVEPTIATLATYYAHPNHQGLAHAMLTNGHVLAHLISPVLFGYLYGIGEYLPFHVATLIACMSVALIYILSLCNDIFELDTTIKSDSLE